MRIVLDTNILARAHQRATGPARRVLLHIVDCAHVLVLSSPILAELERVLTYPRLLKATGLNTSEVGEYLERLAALSTFVEPQAIPSNVLRDNTDAPVLGTAVAGKAEVLCTRDADFFDQKVLDFCRARGVHVLTDIEFIGQYGA